MMKENPVNIAALVLMRCEQSGQLVDGFAGINTVRMTIGHPYELAAHWPSPLPGPEDMNTDNHTRVWWHANTSRSSNVDLY